MLKPEEEGFDPPKAIAKAVAIIQANPDIVAALSTTGGGPTTWAGAQQEAGKKMDRDRHGLHQGEPGPA